MLFGTVIATVVAAAASVPFSSVFTNAFLGDFPDEETVAGIGQVRHAGEVGTLTVERVGHAQALEDVAQGQ